MGRCNKQCGVGVTWYNGPVMLRTAGVVEFMGKLGHAGVDRWKLENE